ncbi:MAG: hypothetical protein PHE55_12370 [Methylococcaceae bacterium]|nr:hypothetical protein [Methylococcaceae bacterium]
MPVLILLLLFAPLTQADWAGFSRFDTVAELAVEADAIRLNLRLKAGAFPLLSQETAGGEVKSLVRILDQDGKALPLRLASLRRVEPGAGEAAQESFFEAELSHSWALPPAQLSVAAGESRNGEIGLVVSHRGVPVSDRATLDKTLKLALDWNDPWRSRIDAVEFVRRHAEPRSYVYIEPYEVRHEMLVRLSDLQPYLDLGLKDGRFVEPDEREALLRKIGSFLLGRNALSIDGAPALPQLDKAEFVRFSRAGIQPVSEPGRLDVVTALVGVILVHLTDKPASALTLQWDLFGPHSGQRAISVIQGEESFEAYVTAAQPRFEWTQEEALEPAALPVEEPEPVEAGPRASRLGESGKVGIIALAVLAWLVLLGLKSARRRTPVWLGAWLVLSSSLSFSLLANKDRPQAMDSQQAKLLLHSLLHNAYRAFQLRDEEKAYDRLAKSLEGDLLDEIYLRQRRVIQQQARGLGGESRVDRVEVLDCQVSPKPGRAYEFTARWMAHGTVSHWGHSHQRDNLYQARLNLLPGSDGRWKIVGLDFQAGKRLEPGA